MAARMAPVIGLLLLLALLPSTSSSGIEFHLDGNVYPTGEFYVTMQIGNPAKPYFLHVDTASNLTWVECHIGRDSCKKCNKGPHPPYQATRDKIVHCEDRLCYALHQDVGKPENCHKEACKYEIRYLEGSWSRGVLLQDKFTFPSGITDPAIAFGCGYDQGGYPEEGVDGVLGLGRGSVDLVSQLKSHKIITKNVIAHCLSSKGGGYLSIGDVGVLSSPVNWVPMAPKTLRNPSFYSPGQATLLLGTKSIVTRPMEVIFDSGSTYTYMPTDIQAQLVAALKATLSKSLKEVHDPSRLQPCWKGPRRFKSLDDIKKELKSVIFLNFHNGATMMIPPENYLVITNQGNACLGILGMRTNMFIIGDITMQDHLFIYDNEKGRLAWHQAQCDKKPKSKSAINSRM